MLHEVKCNPIYEYTKYVNAHEVGCVKICAKRLNNRILFETLDTSHINHPFSIFINGVRYSDSVMNTRLHLENYVLFDLGINEGDSVDHIRGIKLKILEEVSKWKNNYTSYIFRSINDEPLIRTLYVHNFGFIWEERKYKDSIVSWNLTTIDGLLIDFYLKENPDFRLFGEYEGKRR